MISETVEKMFDTYKTVLNADRLYLQDDESVLGHVFISFLSMYIHCKLEQLLKKAELNRKLTPIDLLFKYGRGRWRRIAWSPRFQSR
jgi:transposase